MTGKHAQMTGFSRHLTGEFNLQSLWALNPQHVFVSSGKILEPLTDERTQRDWTFVCDGKRPGLDGKTRPNHGFFPSRDG